MKLSSKAWWHRNPSGKAARLYVLDLKALNVQVVQPQQRNRVRNLKACAAAAPVRWRLYSGFLRWHVAVEDCHLSH